jgi:hypothetical protein
MRLDDFFDQEGIEQVDLMKMDVEGHEQHVLRGGSEVLASGRIRGMLCEFNEHWLREQGGSAQELYSALRDLGFDDEPPARDHGPGSFETRFMVHRSVRGRRKG